MQNNEKISSNQLFFLFVAIILGDSTILIPAGEASTDIWVEFIIAWVASFLLIGLYVYISNTYPSKTLIEILKECFGKFFGSAIGVIYIWYFIHISSLVFRSFSEYLDITTYPETPRIFITIIWMLVVVYIINKGIEVFGRLNELLVPTVFVITLLITTISIDQMDIGNLQPFLKTDISSIIASSFGLLTFPFGEAIVFLMIFPYIKKQEKVAKTAFSALAAAGAFLLVILLRNMLILGADLVSKVIFPSHAVTTLIPNIVLEPFLAVNLLITGGCQTVIFPYAAMVGIRQLLGVDDYKPFVFPVLLICVSLSNWIYADVTEIFRVAKDIYPYYAIPFQIIIPLLILMISIIKNRIKKKSKDQAA